MTLRPESDSAPERRPSKVVVVGAVALLVFSALNIAWLAATRSPELHVAPAVGFIVAFVFLVTAAMVLLKTFSNVKSMDFLVGLVLLGLALAMGGVSLWGDEKYCSSSGPAFLPLPGCRVAFGGFALLTLLVTANAARWWWRKKQFIRSRKPRDDGSHWPGDSGNY